MRQISFNQKSGSGSMYHPFVNFGHHLFKIFRAGSGTIRQKLMPIRARLHVARSFDKAKKLAQ